MIILMRKTQYHSNLNRIKISLNTKKSPAELRSHSLIQI